MKREQVTKFDLEAAFKALDEIEVPKVSGLKPNRINISESTKKVDKTSLLLEDYYDLQNEQDLEDASAEREAEIAKAKLARIEKIVDIDAESEEDILPSYVGKTIIQCPQCMTLYYRKPEDLVKSEEDENIVNVGEQCPNCGHVDGFNVIGKVAAEEPEEIPAEEPVEETEINVEKEPVESEEELPTAEEIPTSEEEASEEEPVELEKVEVEEEQPEEEVSEEGGEEFEEEKEEANESLKVCEKCGKSPCECIEKEEEKEQLNEDADLDKALAEHNEYIDYLQKQIEEEEKELASVKNEEVKTAIQRKIDSLKADLNTALPEAVKSDLAVEELPAADEVPEEAIEGEEEEEETKESLKEDKVNNFEESFKETHSSKRNNIIKKNKEDKEDCEEGKNCKEGEDCIDEKVCKVNKGINHTEEEDIELLNEAGSLEITDADIEALFNSKEFKTPISDAEVRGYLSEARKLKENDRTEYHQASLKAKDDLHNLIRTWESKDLSNADELDEESCNKTFSKYFKEVYENVESFKVTNCEMTPSKLIVEGIINFTSGKQKSTTFEFKKLGKHFLEGINKDIVDKKAFRLRVSVNKNNSLITEGLAYNYTINNAVVRGKIR